MLVDVNLLGPRLRIRRARLCDADASFRWFADPAVTRYLPLAGRGHLSMEAIRDHLAAASTSDRPGVSVTIETLGGAPIGCGGFRSFSDAAAELSLVIGMPEYWGRGYGAEALSLLLELAFCTLSLSEVWLIARADNARAIRLFSSAGFRVVETMQSAAIVDELAYDKVRMALGRDEWNPRAPT